MEARDIRSKTQPRRGLRRVEAVIYVGISDRKFDECVADGIMPKPKRIDGAVVWDMGELDIYFEALPSDTPPPISDEWGKS
jgi:predicted DNA-binding transcriptional regulator AlpA